MAEPSTFPAPHEDESAQIIESSTEMNRGDQSFQFLWQSCSCWKLPKFVKTFFIRGFRAKNAIFILVLINDVS
jgi:hypothetical protein